MNKYFQIKDYAPELIKNPKKFGIEDVLNPQSIITKLPISILKKIMLISAGWVMILKKK